MTDSESLFEKLKSMGVQLGANHLPEPKKKQHSPFIGIETVVNGLDFQTVHGSTFITQDQFPTDYQHGIFPLCVEHEMDILAAWSGATRITHSGGENVVFLDTETSGLAGGTGTYAFLIGIGYRTQSGFELVQFFMRDPGEEAALLAALDQWLTRFSAVVTFNGKTFDLPLLNTRYVLNGFSSPFQRYEHLDVLQIARKLWRDRLPSRALGELEKEIVHFSRTQEEVPGWLIPQLYFDYLRNGDARPLSGVFYHNAQDILSLAALYGHIADLLKDPLHLVMGTYALDLAAIARLYEDMGLMDQAIVLYQRSLEMGDLPEPFFCKTIDRYAQLHRKQGEWYLAAQLWKRAAEHGEASACVELSKYYEHHERNYLEALNWAKKALDYFEVDQYYPGSGKTIEREIEHRIGRLYQRVYRTIGRE